MLREFKAFAIKGNVIDMAVGIIIGAAFTAVVKSFVDDLVMPPLGILTGDTDFSDKFWILKQGQTPPPYESLDKARSAGAVAFAYGRFASQVLGFFIVAFVVFLMVRWIAKLRHPEAEKAPVNTKPCPFCKTTIDIAASRCPSCTSHLESAA